MNYLAWFALKLENLFDTETPLGELISALLLNLIVTKYHNTFYEKWHIALPNDDQALIDTIIRV